MVDEPENEIIIRRGLDVIQSMIDISAERLEGLRTKCNASAELTQQEIRILETKLVKMFSELLITKSKLPEKYSSPVNCVELKQWLKIVGELIAKLKKVSSSYYSFFCSLRPPYRISHII
jgi:kinase suppressor of Ras 2